MENAGRLFLDARNVEAGAIQDVRLQLDRAGMRRAVVLSKALGARAINDNLPCSLSISMGWFFTVAIPASSTGLIQTG